MWITLQYFGTLWWEQMCKPRHPEGSLPRQKGWRTWIILLPNVFTILPNCVPSFHVFPRLFPIAPHFIPILKTFAQNSTLATNSTQSAVIHSNLVWFLLIIVHGCAHNFSFLEEPYWLAHHQCFWNILHSGIEAPLWTPSCKIETSLWGTFSVYIHVKVELWANRNGIKLKCYWERLWEKLEKLGNPMGT
jgi:hypothetical protein